MIEAVGNYGSHLKPPSYYELRVPLRTKGHEEEQMKYGCSIMSDGIMFVNSINASEFMKIEDKVYQFLNNFVEEIGEKNVIQVVTDNGSNYVMTNIGKIAKVKKVIQRHQVRRLHLQALIGFENHEEIHKQVRISETWNYKICNHLSYVAKIAQAKSQSCSLRMNGWSLGQLRIPKG
ncbi:hypothetical protein CR513_27195, partial [Mucuna pruriens]